MKYHSQLKWFLLLLVLLGGAVFFRYFTDDPLTAAKTQLSAKGYKVKAIHYSNPIDDSLGILKKILNRESLRVTCIEWYTPRESLEITEELDRLAPYIETLQCGLTKVSDQDALILGKMHQLKNLQIYGPDLSTRGVSQLSQLKHLTWLELYAPQATDESLRWLEDNDQLGWLYLSDSQAGTATMQRIAHHRELVRLDLQGTRIESSDLHYLTDFPRLHMLELNRTFIDDRAAAYLGQMQSLGTLYLSETEVGDEVCRALAELPELRSLKLDDTLVTDQGVQTLLEGRAPLKDLSLRRCDVSAKAFMEARSWPAELETLSVRGTAINGREILAMIESHPSLIIVGYNQRDTDLDIIEQIDAMLEKRRAHNRNRR